jgi:hypothetical protein
MSKSLALSVAFIVTTSSAAFSQALFDSPGPGYRQQRGRLTPPELRAPGVGGVLVEPRVSNLVWKRIRNSFPKWEPNATDALKLETVALFSSADKDAAEKIRRTLTNAGIPFLVDDAPVVKVDPSRAAEAKALLKKLATEGPSTLRTVTDAEDPTIFDGPESKGK